MGWQGGVPAGGSANTGAAEARVQGPAMGLMVVGGLTAATQLLGFAAQMLGMLGSLAQEDQRVSGLMSGAFGVVGLLIGLAVSGLIIFGGMQMKQLRNWPLCVAASVIGMIPCCTSCCCLVGLPVGIWSLMTLMDNDVKAAFR